MSTGRSVATDFFELLADIHNYRLRTWFGDAEILHVFQAGFQSSKNREFAGERISPEKQIRHSSVFHLTISPVCVGHCYLVQVRKKRLDHGVIRECRHVLLVFLHWRAVQVTSHVMLLRDLKARLVKPRLLTLSPSVARAKAGTYVHAGKFNLGFTIVLMHDDLKA